MDSIYDDMNPTIIKRVNAHIKELGLGKGWDVRLIKSKGGHASKRHYLLASKGSEVVKLCAFEYGGLVDVWELQ